jgi:GT2 family glycosyltransferase
MSVGNEPSVIVVLVTFNRSDILQKALDCLQQQDAAIQEIVVVDNHSSDNTLEVLQKRKAQDPRIQILCHSENAGYGGGLNVGMQWVLENRNPDFMWLMDDDSFPEPDALSLLLSFKRNTDYDLLGLSGYQMGYWTKTTVYPKTHTSDVDFILVDNAILSTSAARKAGVVSGEFFMMCEDYEYCLRLRKAGFKVGIINNNHVKRLNLGSQKFSRTTLWRGYYHSRNHLLILKEFFSFKRLIHYTVLQLKYLLGSLKAPDRQLRIRLRLTGILHGLQGKRGKTLDPVTLTFKK